MKRCISLGLTSLLISSSVYANHGIYLNLDSGWASQSGLPSATEVNAQSVTHKTFPTLWSAGLGYNHDFSNNLGLGFEVDAGYFGKSEYKFANGNSKIGSSVVSYLAQVLGHYHPIDAILKLGFGRVDTTITGLNKQGKIQMHFEIGGGIAYNFGQYFALQAVYMHVFGGGTTSFTPLNKTPRINAVLTGLKITF